MQLHDSYATILSVEETLAGEVIVTATHESMMMTGTSFVRNIHAR